MRKLRLSSRRVVMGPFCRQIAPNMISSQTPNLILASILKNHSTWINISFQEWEAMPERKAWSPEEDEMLKHLREELLITKWSTIAKKMAEEHNMTGRTGKQCRERYHNHLDSTILRADWTPDEQKYLYSLHDEIGNKWAIIAQKLPGRTDNCVKNHFYSKMRKALRKLNKVIHTHFKKQFKEIKMTVLYKIVEATDEKFKTNPNVDQEVSDRCCKLKNTLLEYSNDDDNELEDDLKKLASLAADIHQFSSKYRRKPKRNRRSSVQCQDLLAIPRFEHKVKSSSDYGSDNDSEYSMVFSRDCDNDDSFELGEKPKINKQELEFIKEEEDIKESVNDLNIKIKPPLVRSTTRRNTFCVSDNPKQVEDLLKHEGLLQMSEQFFQPPLLGSKNSERSDSAISEEDKVAENMLSESIERMKIGEIHFDMDIEELDDENKLFVST